ncbi:MAG: helix-hairpin-helix domain-containing protein, partial [Thermomicrobiales bacterium]
MSASIANGDVAELLFRHSRLLEVAGESPFRARAFARAGESIQTLLEPIVFVAAEGRLRDIPGIGEGIAAAIEQIIQTGKFAAHVELTSRFPESLTALTTVPGIGAKTAQRLFRELGVESLVSLEAALVSGKIRETKGLGPRMEATVRAGLEALDRRTGRTPLG